jgi:hypothetical protein
MIDFAAQQLNALQAMDLPFLNAEEDFLFEQCFAHQPI